MGNLGYCTTTNSVICTYKSPSVGKTEQTRKLDWARHVGDNKHIENFSGDTSWKTSTWKTKNETG